MQINTIIGGDYKDGAYAVKKGTSSFNVISFTNGKENISISKVNVKSCDIVDSSTRTSTSSAIVRGVVGATLLGGVGAIAGGLTAKKKSAYTVSLSYRHNKQDKKSLLYISDEVYQALIRELF